MTALRKVGAVRILKVLRNNKLLWHVVHARVIPGAWGGSVAAVVFGNPLQRFEVAEGTFPAHVVGQPVLQWIVGRCRRT
jgi:hypothetical protein